MWWRRHVAVVDAAASAAPKVVLRKQACFYRIWSRTVFDQSSNMWSGSQRGRIVGALEADEPWSC